MHNKVHQIHNKISVVLVMINTYLKSVFQLLIFNRYVQIFQRSSSHLKIPGSRMVTCSKFHTNGTLILGPTVQNLVTRQTWRPGFV